MIIWDDNLKTGIAIIDEQHQLLFETINKLNKFKETKDNFHEVLFDLQAYVSVHFNTEETYMKCLNYPDYSNHKACHDKFVDDCTRILNKNETVNAFAGIAEELVVFVEDWIQNHYTNEDVKMASYISNNHLYANFL